MYEATGFFFQETDVVEPVYQAEDLKTVKSKILVKDILYGVG
jgi:hypothetical protein